MNPVHVALGIMVGVYFCALVWAMASLFWFRASVHIDEARFNTWLHRHGQ